MREQGKLREAEGLYRQIIDHDKRNFLAYSRLGTIHLQEGRPQSALEALQTAVELNPDSGEARCNLATALQVLGRGAEAIAAYEDALGINSGYAEAWYGLANALQAKSREDEAAACFSAGSGHRSRLCRGALRPGRGLSRAGAIRGRDCLL